MTNLRSPLCNTTTKLLGDYWTLRVIDSLALSDARFCELQRRLDSVNPVTLTSKLKKLEDAKLIIRSEETVDKISVSYALTPLGREAMPVINALNNFAVKTKVA